MPAIIAPIGGTERKVDLQKREIELLKCELEEAHALADLAAKPIMMGASQVRGRGYGSGPHEVQPHMGTSAPRGGAPTIPPPHGQATLSGLHKGPPSGGQTHVKGRWEDSRQPMTDPQKGTTTRGSGPPSTMTPYGQATLQGSVHMLFEMAKANKFSAQPKLRASYHPQ
ncbi:uncharacterized protein EI90DRAFT_3018979 [Cantharellus anzutake]|uniref:uncharacterized protein n=1 Tax=Cantharellus anzutake TaxID=1750568 RepID=UPI0019030B66|nr:uncharacterized protein EI90DRAFT_3018979 [Cantharellus anzutake]KAF8325644.1 hypothetical protein EI90DRAFT_3018979 [Cantharellus anzutake]